MLMVKNIFSEAVAQRCFMEKVFLETSQNSQENTCALLIKLQAWGLNFEFWILVNFVEISKNTFFTGHLWWLFLALVFNALPDRENFSDYFLFSKGNCQPWDFVDFLDRTQEFIWECSNKNWKYFDKVQFWMKFNFINFLNSLVTTNILY